MRKNAFQGKSLFEGSNIIRHIKAILGGATIEGTPDGLMAALNNTTLYAAASGKVIPLGQDKFEIVVLRVGTFVHDGFDFEGEQPLGNWHEVSPPRPEGFFRDWPLDARNQHIVSPPYSGIGVALSNKAFRDFREQTGYGCDFRIMSHPMVDAIKEYRYTYSKDVKGSAK